MLRGELRAEGQSKEQSVRFCCVHLTAIAGWWHASSNLSVVEPPSLLSGPHGFPCVVYLYLISEDAPLLVCIYITQLSNPHLLRCSIICIWTEFVNVTQAEFQI